MLNLAVAWKGATFNQVVARLKVNSDDGEGQSLMFGARPQKHYRREIASVAAASFGTQRGGGMRILDFETPGATVVNSSASDDTTGLCATMDFGLTENQSERPCSSAQSMSSVNVNNAEVNARRRVRSSGMIPRKFNDRGDTGDSVFKPSYRQYLSSRALTFDQNQFNYLRQGTRSAIPGDNLSMDNVYASNAQSSCPKKLISAARGNNTLLYTWIDGTEYTVTFDDGYYDIEDFRTALRVAMISNATYYVSIADATEYFFLLDLWYDSYNRRVVVQCVQTSSSLHSSSYEVPVGAGATWTIPTAAVVPSFTFSAAMARLLGINGGTAGTYGGGSGGNQVFYGYGSELVTTYRPIYYKPNNVHFAHQGAVDASDRVTRVKYNAITNSAASFLSAYGSQTAAANAYAYCTNDGKYNDVRLKKYVAPVTPVVNAQTGEACCKTYFTYRRI